MVTTKDLAAVIRLARFAVRSAGRVLAMAERLDLAEERPRRRVAPRRRRSVLKEAKVKVKEVKERVKQARVPDLADGSDDDAPF